MNNMHGLVEEWKNRNKDKEESLTNIVKSFTLSWEEVFSGRLNSNKEKRMW